MHMLYECLSSRSMMITTVLKTYPYRRCHRGEIVIHLAWPSAHNIWRRREPNILCDTREDGNFGIVGRLLPDLLRSSRAEFVHIVRHVVFATSPLPLNLIPLLVELLQVPIANFSDCLHILRMNLGFLRNAFSLKRNELVPE